MSKLFLLFSTLKYLKWQQVYSRIFRKYIKAKVTECYLAKEPSRSEAWLHVTLYPEKITTNLEALFLNYTKTLNLPEDWNSEIPSKLWVYNLHYFEDLLSENSRTKKQFHLELLRCWMDQNKVGIGNGWEAYPTSLRISNVIKAWLAGLELDEKLFKSIFDQASYLSNNLEKHLLGNHYFVNLKALLFAGVLFEQQRWLELAEDGLLGEIPEQILSDGANFELTPMYHALILVDMLDMYNLGKAYPRRVSTKLLELIEFNIPPMLRFMESMAHPDGGVSFFNDSVDGIAPSKSCIEYYAKNLGFSTSSMDTSITQIVDHRESGYVSATLEGAKLIFDAANVGPDYIPGHAHADTLSFEMSIGNERVFVNTGISEYGQGLNRLQQRKTFSHNTVEVDGKDSSQVWSGFRVAERARVSDRQADMVSDNQVVLQAAHDGYKSLFGGCKHHRRLSFYPGKLVVADTLSGRFKFAKARFYFHPYLNVSLNGNFLEIRAKRFTLQSDLTEKIAKLSESTWHPQFGVAVVNKMLEVEFQSDQLETVFAWTSC